MNLMEKLIRERKTISDNISYLVDNKKCLCQNEKLHPLTNRTGKYISETTYIYLEGIIMQDSHRNIALKENEVLTTQK